MMVYWLIFIYSSLLRPDQTESDSLMNCYNTCPVCTAPSKLAVPERVALTGTVCASCGITVNVARLLNHDVTVFVWATVQYDAHTRVWRSGGHTVDHTVWL
jgi:hypothetical protein